MNITLGVAIAALGVSIVALAIFAAMYSNSQTEIGLLQTRVTNQSQRLSNLGALPANLTSTLQNVKTLQQSQGNQISSLGKNVNALQERISSFYCHAPKLCTYHLESGNSTYLINYRFNGMVESMNASAGYNTLVINILARDSGNLEITVPRALINSTSTTGSDFPFVVFVDSINTPYKEYISRYGSANALDMGINDVHPENYKILDIPVAAGSTTVEILGVSLV